jgi:hypothetical protein
MGTLISKAQAVTSPSGQLGLTVPPPMDRAQLVRAVIRGALSRDTEFARYAGRTSESPNAVAGFLDYLFATPGDQAAPEFVFDRLRWGGLIVYASWDPEQVQRIATQFGAKVGFTVERSPTFIRQTFFGLPLPWGNRVHFFAARKTQLIFPGTMTDRFTYDVQLVRKATGTQPWVVQKQIPEYSNVLWRLRERFADASMELVANRARKLVDKVFPVFLTREAAFLNILQRDLPKQYADRVPKVLSLDKDKRGLVRRMELNWLRNGGPQLTQLQFAQQSTDLLRALHDVAQIIHLDLRLDNFVITDHGVGFVDFGSAVRVGEDLSESQMLTTLFEEMMQTSSIQRMLGKMKKAGRVTSRIITASHQKVDKAIDLFYLAVQINSPHKNPDFRDLVRFDAASPEAATLATLTDQVLRPDDPENPTYRSAADVLVALNRVAQQLQTQQLQPKPKTAAPGPGPAPAAVVKK